mmetsp:Transcript_23483/g.55472  ORF Transcript_23483/g.55472 Transcript_23483/m.55472 type:complete len:820 (+) Transcript_23483:331-2790(+)
MKFFVRRLYPDQTTITLSGVDDSIRISDVKRIVQGKWEIDPKFQRLIFSGRELHDSQTVADCKITDECVVQLVESLRRPSAKIFVETHTGRRFAVDVDHNTTVIDVKRKIHSAEGVGPHCQRLISARRSDLRLNCSKTLEEYNIHHGDTLHLIITVPFLPATTIFVNTIDRPVYNIPLDVNHNTTVLDVKRMLRITCGVVPEGQYLINTGRQLEDSKTLEDYGIYEGSSLHSVLRAESLATRNEIRVPHNKIRVVGVMGHLSLEYEGSATILDVKRKIRPRLSDVVPEHHELYFGEREMSNHDTLEHCGIRGGSILCMVLRDSVDKVLIKVKWNGDKGFQIWVAKSILVGGIKKLISNMTITKVGGGHQRLVCASKELKDDSLPIGHYAKADCASVELELYTNEPDDDETVSLEETLVFQVKTVDGSKVTLNAESSETIRNLKARLTETHGVGFDDHILRFSGRELQDSATLEESGVQNVSLLRIIKICKHAQKPVQEPDATKINVTLPNKDALVIDNVATSDSAGSLKLQICSMKDIKPDEHRLVYRGSHLAGEDYSLAHFGIGDKSDVQLLPNKKKPDALEEYLMMSAEERENAVEPIKALRKKARSEGASDFYTYKFVKLPDILHESQRTILCELLDFMWHNTAIDGAIRTGMFLPILTDQLVAIVSSLDGDLDDKYKASKLIEKLKTRFYSVPGSESSTFKIVLSLTKGPSPCANFECLQTDARSTSEVLLNSPEDYKGGEMAFFVNDEVDILPRAAGSLVQYPPKVLRGITSVVEGTRMSLLILDKDDAAGIDLPLTLTGDDVVSFLAHRACAK